MLRVALINLPFADFNRPPIGLAQLRSVLETTLSDRVETSIFHLNLDFAARLSLPVYAVISNTVDAMLSGLGDWLFRPVAFPEASDNVSAYFRRYPRTFGAHQLRMQELLLQHRNGMADFLDELIDTYRLDGFDVVGFTSMFQQNLACFAMARRLKSRNPALVTLMGGANCESRMGRAIVRNVEPIDFVFSGPSLKTFPTVVGFLADGQPERCHEIKGVFSRERLARSAGQDLNEIGAELDINQEVPVDYEDYLAALARSLPHAPTRPHLLFETSRGCWWGERAHCTFCGLNGMSMAYRSLEPRRALAQFEKLFASSSRVERFESVDNIMPKEYLTEVFPHIRSPKDIFYEVKADLSDGDLEVLAGAGVRSIQPGIEALSTPTLKLMKKGTTATQNIRFLKGCLRNNITPMWNLLVGFPGEPEDSYRKYCLDIPLLFHLPPPSGVHPVRFDRFSPYFNLAREYGLQLKAHPFYGFVYPFDDETVSDLAYYFVDQNLEAPYLQAMIAWLRPMHEKVVEWRARWNGADGKPRPELYFERRDGGLVVHDSRSEEASTLELGEAAGRVLERLMSPATPARLEVELADLGPDQLAREVSFLREHGLLFSDGEHLLSLPAAARAPEYVVKRWPMEGLLAAFWRDQPAAAS